MSLFSHLKNRAIRTCKVVAGQQGPAVSPKRLAQGRAQEMCPNCWQLWWGLMTEGLKVGSQGLGPIDIQKWRDVFFLHHIQRIQFKQAFSPEKALSSFLLNSPPAPARA